jgi:Peptidase family M1 domain/Secretion system C-terminal sorting domain/Peptidase M1 N-terminal domain
MKKNLLLFLCLIFNGFVVAQKQSRAAISRSDSADITKTIINITNINKSAKTINANAILHIKSRINNLQTILLDLQDYVVDSVLINTVNTNFNYTSPLISIPLSNSLNANDSVIAQVFYHGSPPTDAKWGGFYFSGVYAFNMGVGFESQPHNVGRMLFPCFDNFVERCPYEFNITSAPTDMAICNGLLVDSFVNANNDIVWHWNLQENIPSYLVSVTVAPYVLVKKNLTSISGGKQLWIACLPSDSNKVNASFANLQQSFTMLENHFGEYKWPRVGYSLVPFSAGAMEHACNIHIGLVYIDGTLTYETLIAHELSHHWFGNLATCSTAQDMWLNEGFASYCEMLHQEYVYGKAAYTKAYKDNHFKMLSTAHINDDAYRAISNMDSNYTYSTTVYSKGADMIHTLRSYIGDSLFFNSIKKYLSQHEYQSVSTTIFNQSLNVNSGINLNNYFADWIAQPGFANFCIDSTTVTLAFGKYKTNVFVRQRKHKNTNYYSNVLLPITFFKADGSHVTVNKNFTNQCMQYQFELDFEPAFICIDEDEMISDASTANTLIVKGTNGFKQFPEGKARLRVIGYNNPSDSSVMRIEHHWVAPDRFKTAKPNYVLHDARYWQVNGINVNNIKGFLVFSYDASANNNYLDSIWLVGAENNIRLFYRKDARDDWQFANDSLVAGSLTDKIGQVYCKDIKPGEYALGINRPGFTDALVTDAPSGPCAVITSLNNLQNIPNNDNDGYDIFPNPNAGEISIRAKQLSASPITITISTIDGKLLQTDTLLTNQVSKKINTQLPDGQYLIQIYQSNILLQTTKIAISR